MLAAVRQASLRVPRCARFATVATSKVLASELPAGLLRPPVRTVPSTEARSAKEISTTTSTFTPPLFLTMSALIRTKHNMRGHVVELDPFIFSHPIRRDILHLCVVHRLDGLRQGSASTKTRAEVRGSGRKIRPQKGSGRARLADAQSPMLRGGGVAFGPKPRDFSTKLPRKVLEMGMRVALSAKVREHSLGVVSTLEWPRISTKELAARVADLGWQKTLFVTGLDEVPFGLRKSSSNIPNVDTITAQELTVYDALKWNRLVLDVAAVQYFEQTLGKTEMSQ